MAEPLKNHFDRDVVELLAARVGAVHPGFDAAGFTSGLLAAFPALELKDRINLVADALATHLPDHYPTALGLVLEVAASDEDPPVEGFAAWPLCSFVERHGVDHPDASLTAMETLTRRFSCEFAIRPFLDNELDLTRTYLRRWVDHEDEAVRRLPSEGTRPRLPWGPKVEALLDDPEIGIELLEALRHDPSETVRRSVANHLNDIARDHPNRVVEITRAWAADPDVEPTMIRHALRSLVKKGHPGALDVLGFTNDPRVEMEGFAVTPAELTLGHDINLTATVTSTGPGEQKLVVDFVIHHVTARGSTSTKVFKWTTLTLGPGETVQLAKRRRIATASTRRYHAGVHRVDLQIGGQILASTEFRLLESSV